MKPEIYSSSDYCALSLHGREAFRYLVQFADDEGRLKISVSHLATAAFQGLPDVDPDDLAPQLALMQRRGMIKRYKVHGMDYVAVVNFTSHQLINRPSPSRLPPPPAGGSKRKSPARGHDGAEEKPAVDRAAGSTPETAAPKPTKAQARDPVMVVSAWLRAHGYAVTKGDATGLRKDFHRHQDRLPEDYFELWAVTGEEQMRKPLAIAFSRARPDQDTRVGTRTAHRIKREEKREEERRRQRPRTPGEDGPQSVAEIAASMAH